MKKISPFSLIIHSKLKAEPATTANKVISLLIKPLLNFNIYSKTTPRTNKFKVKVTGKSLFHAKFINKS
jgi:hypothetical protein